MGKGESNEARPCPENGSRRLRLPVAVDGGGRARRTDRLAESGDRRFRDGRVGGGRGVRGVSGGGGERGPGRRGQAGARTVVVEDLVREYFSGCRLVLVRGTLEAPELLKAASGYAVRFVDGTEKSFTAEALAGALRAPRLRRMSKPGP